MDALVVLPLLIALAISAIRWGYDSRDGLTSKERPLASYKVRWPGGSAFMTTLASAAETSARRRSYASAQTMVAWFGRGDSLRATIRESLSDAGERVPHSGRLCHRAHLRTACRMGEEPLGRGWLRTSPDY
jgi:hypothetical protein